MTTCCPVKACCRFNKFTSVFHAFHHKIVKVAVDPRGDSQVDPQTLTDNVMTKFIVKIRTGASNGVSSLFFLR